MELHPTIEGERDSVTSPVQNSSEAFPAWREPEKVAELRSPFAALDLLTLFWQDRALLTRITFYGALLTVLAVIFVPNRYQATTRLMPPDSRAGSQMAIAASLLSKTGAAGDLASSLVGATASGALLMGVLRSDTVADDLIRQFDLKKRYGVRLDVDARNRLTALTALSEDRKSGIITIAVSDRSPRRAADLAAAYVDELNRLLAEVNTSAAHRERVFVDERLREVTQDLHDAELRLSEFSAKNVTIDPKEQGKAMVGAAVALQAELIARQTELRGLQQVYSDQNVRIRGAQARIAELRRQLQELQGNNLPLPLGSSEDAGAGYPTFRKLPALGVTYQDLFREVALRERVFEMLTAQGELAKVEEAKEIATVKVLDLPEVPEKKFAPRRLNITILSALLSFGLGVVCVLARGLWRGIDCQDSRRRFAAAVWQDVEPSYTRWRRVIARFVRKAKWGNSRDHHGWAGSLAPLELRRGLAGVRAGYRTYGAKKTNDEADALAWLHVLWEQRLFLMRATAASLVMGALFAVLVPNRYESAVRLMPPDGKSGAQFATLAALADSSGGLAAAAGDLLGVRSPAKLFIGILRSRTLEDRLVEKFNLRTLYREKLKAEARQTLAERTAISEDAKSGIISIDVTDRDPRRAAAIAQAFVQELNQLVEELSTSAAHRERVFLEGRLAVVKHELDDASNQLSEFSSKNTAVDLKEQGRALVGEAATLAEQLTAEESEAKNLAQIYAPGNVRVRSVEARIAELRNQLGKLTGAEAGKNNPAPGSADSYPSLRQLPSLAVTYADLYRRAKTQEALYEVLTKEFELARAEEAKEVPSVQVLDPARVPERKSYPPRLLLVIVCAALGWGGASVVTLAKSKWQRLDAQNPERVLAQEIFQTVNARMPWSPTNGSRLQAFTHRAWVRLAQRKDTLENSMQPHEADGRVTRQELGDAGRGAQTGASEAARPPV